MPVSANEPPEILTEAGKESLTGFVADVIGGVLSDSAYQAFEYPDFLANDDPVGVPAQFQRQIGRLACRSYARGGGPQNLPGFDAAWGGLCGPYLDSIGEAPTPGGGVDVPFSGGQCPGVNYRVSWSWSAGAFNSGPLTADRTGPLSFDRSGTGSLDCGPSGGTYTVITMREGTGNSPVNIMSGCGATLNGITVQRLDGQPDECGDPPPEYDPPKIKPGLPTIPTTPVDFPGIGPIGVDINFDPDGTINVSLPDIGVEVGIEDPFGLGGDGGGTPPGGGAPPPGDVGSPGSPEAVGPGGEAEGEAPPGSVLTGVRVQITAFPNSRAKYTEDVFRGAYYVYMGVPGLLDLDFGGAMVRQDQFFFAEQPNLTKWRVSANTGYELITTPYYREIEAA